MSAALHPAYSYASDPARLDCARCGEVLSGPRLECRFCSNPDRRPTRFRFLGPVLIATATLLLLHLIAVIPASVWAPPSP